MNTRETLYGLRCAILLNGQHSMLLEPATVTLEGTAYGVLTNSASAIAIPVRGETTLPESPYAASIARCLTPGEPLRATLANLLSFAQSHKQPHCDECKSTGRRRCRECGTGNTKCRACMDNRVVPVLIGGRRFNAVALASLAKYVWGRPAVTIAQDGIGWRLVMREKDWAYALMSLREDERTKPVAEFEACA